MKNINWNSNTLWFLTWSDILNFLLNPKTGSAPEFVMEVTDKTRADVKVSKQIQYTKSLYLYVWSSQIESTINLTTALWSFQFSNPDTYVLVPLDFNEFNCNKILRISRV